MNFSRLASHHFLHRSIQTTPTTYSHEIGQNYGYAYSSAYVSALNREKNWKSFNWKGEFSSQFPLPPPSPCSSPTRSFQHLDFRSPPLSKSSLSKDAITAHAKMKNSRPMKGWLGEQGRIPIKSNEEIFLPSLLPVQRAQTGPVCQLISLGDFKIMAGVEEGRFIVRASSMPFQNWNVHHKCLNGPKTSLYLVRTYKYWAFALARPLSYISPPTGWCTEHVPCCLCKAHFLGDNCTVISRNSSFLCATGGERTGLEGEGVWHTRGEEARVLLKFLARWMRPYFYAAVSTAKTCPVSR